MLFEWAKLIRHMETLTCSAELCGKFFCVAGFCVAGFCVAGFCVAQGLVWQGFALLKIKMQKLCVQRHFSSTIIHKIHTAIHQIFSIAGCHLNYCMLSWHPCLCRLVLPLVLLGMPIKVSVVIKVSLQQEANELMLGSLEAR